MCSVEIVPSYLGFGVKDPNRYSLMDLFVFYRDTAGQERFESITKQFYRRAEVCENLKISISCWEKSGGYFAPKS